MAQRTLFCPSCSEILPNDAVKCPRCGECVQYDANDIMMDVALHARKKSLIPWGLIFFFALYLAGSYTFVRYYTQTTPEYKAAVHFSKGDQILGDDEGKTAEDQQLIAAFNEYVEGSKLTPGDSYGQMRIETILRRLNERHISLDKNQQREMDLLARMYAMDVQRRKPILFVGIRDTWDIDALEELPLKIFNYSLVIAVFIMILWVIRSWRLRRHYDQLASSRIEEKRVENLNEKEYAAYIREKRRKLRER